MLRFPPLGLTLGLALFPLSSQVRAEAVDPTVAKFAALEGVINVSISPNGQTVAILAPRPQGGEAILVVPVAAGKLVAIPGSDGPGSNGEGERLRYCGFATDTRIVCNATFNRREGRYFDNFSRLIAVDSNGQNMKVLTPGVSSSALYDVRQGGSLVDLVSPDGGNSILISRASAEEFSTGTLTARNRPGLGVISVDTLSGKFREIEPPRRTAFDYLADGQGNVRIMAITRVAESGQLAGRDTYQYRKIGSREWLPLSVVQFSDAQTASGFLPVAIDGNLDAVYGFGNHAGFKALFRKSLANDSSAPELVLSRNDVDVDQLIRIGRNNRVVGASYATEKREVEFFDPDLRKLASALIRALPKGSKISFVDASSDESKLVLYVSSDTNPGTFYLFDKGTRQLAEIAPLRAELAGAALAAVKPVRYAAADGTLIPAYLTLPPGSDGRNLAAIVMPHGGPSARDEWGFDWLAQFFAAKGYAVLQPNYRGSAGYGMSWYQKNGFKSWKVTIGDVNDAGRWLVTEGIAAPGRLGVVGWSYGGYAALQSQVLDPDVFKAVIAIAPVTDLELLRGESQRYNNRDLVSAFIGQGPHVAEGSPARHADRFKAPVLLFHGDVDQNVASQESQLMANRLKAAGKRVEYIEFKGLDHYLDDSAARTRLLSESADFLSVSLSAAVAPTK